MSDILPELNVQQASSEHRLEPRYLDRGIKYRRKQQKKSRNKSKQRHTLKNNRIKALDNIRQSMTIAHNNPFIHNPFERLTYDGFGNIVPNEKEHHKADSKVGGDFVKLEDLSKDSGTDKLNDLEWLYGSAPTTEPNLNLYPGEPGLSQTGPDKITVDVSVDDDNDERERDEERIEIEEEIKRKFAELEGLMDKIHAVRGKRRRRHSKKRLRSGCNGGQTSDSVNIIPIERERRLAQPIRNALLIRSAMKRAWKGSLGSCCGMGCWAHWKWVNIKHVLSDYE